MAAGKSLPQVLRRTLPATVKVKPLPFSGRSLASRKIDEERRSQGIVSATGLRENSEMAFQIDPTHQLPALTPQPQPRPRSIPSLHQGFAPPSRAHRVAPRRRVRGAE